MLVRLFESISANFWLNGALYISLKKFVLRGVLIFIISKDGGRNEDVKNRIAKTQGNFHS